MTKDHKIKTLKHYFADIVEGSKTFEFRKNDRDYQVGDTVRLVEIDGEGATGRQHEITISYALYGTQHNIIGLPIGYCIFAWNTRVDQPEPEPGKFVKFIAECKKNNTKWISVKWLWDAQAHIDRLERENKQLRLDSMRKRKQKGGE